jgi:hypothetical protein
MSATSPDQHEVRRLIDLMKDPRYWRDNDPSVLSDVRSGFKNLYPTFPRWVGCVAMMPSLEA